MVFVGENGKPTKMPNVFRNGFMKYRDRKPETEGRDLNVPKL